MWTAKKVSKNFGNDSPSTYLCTIIHTKQKISSNMKKIFFTFGFIFGLFSAVQSQTITMADVRAEYGDLPKLEKSYAPTLWGMAQGTSECCSTYLVASLQKVDGNGKPFRTTYLTGYDADSNQVLQIMVTDPVVSPDGKQASVMQNGYRIDLSMRLD